MTRKPLFTRTGRPRRAQAGITLIELMVAITLDLVIVAAVTTLYVKNSAYRTQIERAGQQIENGRYAMQVLTDDLQQAGYLAELDVISAMSAVNPPANWPKWQLTETDANLVLPANPCVVGQVGLQAALPYAVQSFKAATAPACVTDVKTNTDVILIRRVSSCNGGAADCPLVPGSFYFQASSCNNSTQLGSINAGARFRLRLAGDPNLNRLNRDCASNAPVHQLLVHIYFIANNDQPGDGIPTLKMAELTGGAFSIVSIASGIENLQLEYGVDKLPAGTGDGFPDDWTIDPLTYGGCALPACAAHNTLDVVSVRVNLLARSLTTRSGYIDRKTYTLGVNAAGVPRTFGPFNDAYERHAFVGTVRLNNPSLRREL